MQAIKSSNNRLLAAALGVVYLLVGLVGFAVTGFDGFASSATTDKLIIFQLNGLHNVVHLAVGGLLVFAAMRSVRDAVTANIVVGGTYLVVGLLGLFLLGAEANIIGINHPDNALHIVSAIGLLFVGLASDRVDVISAPQKAFSESAAESGAADWVQTDIGTTDDFDIETDDDLDWTITDDGVVDALDNSDDADNLDWATTDDDVADASDNFDDTDDLVTKSKEELYELAQSAGIPGRSTMSRVELAAAIRRTRVS